jgi:hypothetical protein
MGFGSNAGLVAAHFSLGSKKRVRVLPDRIAWIAVNGIRPLSFDGGRMEAIEPVATECASQYVRDWRMTNE